MEEGVVQTVNVIFGVDNHLFVDGFPGQKVVIYDVAECKVYRADRCTG